MKKILSLLTAITLTASDTSSVVSCNNNPAYTQNDVNIVNSIINDLNKTNSYGVTELSSGTHLFKEYKNNILKQIQNKIIKNYKNLVSFKDNQNNKILSTTYTKIVLTIQSGKYIKTFNVNVKLGYDAQTIANKLSTKIEVKRQLNKPKDSDYQKEDILNILKTKLTTQEKTAIGNSLTFNFANSNLTWYKTPVIENGSLAIGQDKQNFNFNLYFQYGEQKKIWLNIIKIIKKANKNVENMLGLIYLI